MTHKPPGQWPHYRVARLRAYLDVSQEHLARLVDKSVCAIGNIERGRTTASRKTRAALDRLAQEVGFEQD